ncbi:MAG: biopolymer transporter ExbD [Nitrospirales bacterium]|nr:biopolymer transporter ExbD [Nitrospira sp.]MDR4501846.1 biopolymer transporter ExbD [Nitrospirales bacterium]
MKFPAAAKKKARIEIIPMIDTMFFLLVFFMIATLSMTMQRGMPVNLPEAGSTTDNVKEQISLTITDQGDLFFNKKAITLDQLGDQLQQARPKDSDPSVVINADEHVDHGVVVKVMDRVRLSGIPNMAIATKPENTPDE